MLAMLLYQHRNRIHFLLTYDNSPEVREIYHWSTQMLDREWNYTINRTDDQTGRTTDKGKRYMGKEVFILNYDAPAALPEQLPLICFLPFSHGSPVTI